MSTENEPVRARRTRRAPTAAEHPAEQETHRHGEVPDAGGRDGERSDAEWPDGERPDGERPDGERRSGRHRARKQTAAKETAAKQTTAKQSGPAPRKRTRAAGRQGKRSAPVVAVTGAAQGIGLLVAQRLSTSTRIGKVIAVDTVRGDVPEATWRLGDVRDPAIAQKLGGVDAIVHLALDMGLDSGSHDRHTLNVRGTATVLTAAAAAGVHRVIILSSAMVYGALPDNPVPLGDDAALRATPDGEVLGDLLEIERLAAQAPRTHPGLSVTVVRPAALVGPGVDTVLTRHFEAPRLLAVRGGRPAWQFCHIDDLAGAFETVVVAGDGLVDSGTDHIVVTVGSDGWLERDEIERITGKRGVEVPAAFAFATAERLHRIGVLPTAATDLHFLVHPWAVDARRLRAAGWSPRYSNEEALLVQLAESTGRTAIGGHRLGRRDAAAGAAVGATVALVGTAALVRRARKRRRR